MGYGLVGVFTTLVVFMLVIKLITVIFPEKEDRGNVSDR